MSFFRKISSWYTRQSVGMKTAVVSGVFGLLAVVVGMLPGVVGSLVRDKGLRLVDATILEDEGYPRLDIKLRNLGPHVSFVKGATFEVSEVVDLDLPGSGRPKAEPVSWKYDVELPLRGAPYAQAVPLAQRLDPNEVDRFQFILGSGAATGSKPHILVMRVALAYDESRSTLQTGTLLVYLPPSVAIVGYYDPASKEINVTGFSFRRIAEANEEKLRRIAGIEGTRSTHVQLLLQKSDKPINLFGEELAHYSPCDQKITVAMNMLKPASDDTLLMAREIKHKAAAGYLRQAVEHCESPERLYSALALLGNSYFLSGGYVEAEATYRRLSTLETPQGVIAADAISRAALLEKCREDAELDVFRTGLLYLEGVHLEKSYRDRALAMIRKAATTSCPELRATAEKFLTSIGEHL